ncbi:MAG: tetratricopeptide repeat protein [Desulfovibrio sp.]|nr:tetratricopeptide repeat protein [Desulfovibrio sp.]
MSDIFVLPGRARILIVVLALGLGAMLVTSLAKQANHVSVQEVAQPHDRPPAAQGGGGPGMSAMGGMGGDAIGALMQQAAREPENAALLIQLAEALMQGQKWDAAATFAQRAVALKPDSPHPLYLLGVIRHNQGQHKEAAQLLEQVARLHDDPSVRYSLGVLYLHYLQDNKRGMEHLTFALNAPSTSEELKAAIRKELEEHAPLPPESAATGQQDQRP